MIYKSVCFVGGENVFWKLCTFSCCCCLVFCLLGSFPHPETAPRLHIFLQVSQGTVNCPTRWSMHCPLVICINHIYFKTQISNEIKCSSVLVKSWIVDAQLEHRDRSRPPFLCDRCASLSQVGIFQSVHIYDLFSFLCTFTIYSTFHFRNIIMNYSAHHYYKWACLPTFILQLNNKSGSLQSHVC